MDLKGLYIHYFIIGCNQSISLMIII